MSESEKLILKTSLRTQAMCKVLLQAHAEYLGQQGIEPRAKAEQRLLESANRTYEQMLAWDDVKAALR